jgi:hypothetical protein
MIRAFLIITVMESGLSPIMMAIIIVLLLDCARYLPFFPFAPATRGWLDEHMALA